MKEGSMAEVVVEYIIDRISEFSSLLSKDVLASLLILSNEILFDLI